MDQCPALFISHGAPTFALEPGLLGPQLAVLGAGLSDVAAVLVVSAHWQTRGISVMTTPQPSTVHDFGGFPEELYRLQYPAPGAPAQAAMVVERLTEAGFTVSLNSRRGLDHGAWVPLLHMLPRANVPVFQVSLPIELDTAGALQLGAALAPVRMRGVLVVGSGSLTHNLGEYFQGAVATTAYAQDFAGWARQRLQARDTDDLVRYRSLAPQAARAHPTEEHILPLLVAYGASDASDTFRAIDGGMDHGVLSMDSFAWGLHTHTTMASRSR
jgi:4,5-DOPA dioxygenase extradiol